MVNSIAGDEWINTSYNSSTPYLKIETGQAMPDFIVSEDSITYGSYFGGDSEIYELKHGWGERFTGYGQAMVRNGGRNGIALSFGFRWALGKKYLEKI